MYDEVERRIDFYVELSFVKFFYKGKRRRVFYSVFIRKFIIEIFSIDSNFFIDVFFINFRRVKIKSLCLYVHAEETVGRKKIVITLLPLYFYVEILVNYVFRSNKFNDS